MEEGRLWAGTTCPLCKSNGVDSKLQFYRLNLRAACLLCPHKTCPFPLTTDYPDTFVRVQKGKIVPGSQSERGSPYREEDESDDSYVVSDSSEDSDSYLDFLKQYENHNVLSVNTDKKGSSEVSGFDINTLDFEIDDSLDTLQLQNEIQKLESEIAKNVENMKTIPPKVIGKNSSLSNNSKKLISVPDKEFKSSDNNIGTEQHRELDINDSSCVKKNQKEVEGCDDRKIIVSVNISESHVKKQHDIFPMTNISNPEPKPSMSSSLEDIKNTKDNDLIDGCEKHAESVTIERDNDFGKMCGDKEMVIFDEHTNSDPSNNSVAMAIMSNTEPLVLPPHSTKNNLSKHSLQEELVSSELVTFKKRKDCGKNNCDEEMDVIYDERSQSYKIVTIDCDTSSTGVSQDSEGYDIIKVSFCKTQKSSGAIVRRKTKKVQHSAPNTVEKLCSNLVSVKRKVVAQEGPSTFVGTSSSSVSELEEVKELQKKNKIHSENCRCFLCEGATGGITSHLDRALVDLFPEECTLRENKLENYELPTEKEIMRDFVHYMSGNIKSAPKKKKRLFHL